MHGVIFVVDSSDYCRLDEAKDVLRELLGHEKISGKPVLLLANKQDCDEALDELDLVEKLQLESLVNQRKCPTLVETCSATDLSKKTRVDPGIQKGYYWLLNYIARNYNSLNERVERDVVYQKVVEEEARKEKLDRLRKLNHASEREEDKIESYSDYDRKMNGSITRLQDNFDNDENIFYINTAFSNDDATSLSSKSRESFPNTYYSNFEQEEPERPKSAVQLVKKHLELENHKRKASFPNIHSNKTAPANLYGVRQKSAIENRKKFIKQERVLRSADNACVSGNLPNGLPMEGQGHRELFTLNNFQNVHKLPPLKIKLKENNESLIRNRINKSELSVIDID